MMHEKRARNARPYGYGGTIRGYFFRNVVGARIARPLLEFVQNFGFVHLPYKTKTQFPLELRFDFEKIKKENKFFFRIGKYDL